MIIHGSCFVVRKESFENIGLFDENIFMYGEEADIHWRLKNSGRCDFVYNNKLVYWHLHKANDDNVFNLKNLVTGLESKLYLNDRDGLDRKKVVKREIKQTRILLLKMKIRSFCGKGRDKNYNNLVLWHDYLKKKSTEMN